MTTFTDATKAPRNCKPVLLSVVIPCYNEHEVLRLTAATLANLFARLMSEGILSRYSEICFVDDGSKDGTWQVIAELCRQSSYFRGIKLSRNFGHQNALLAGLLSSNADATVSMDADLQDDVGAIEGMIREYRLGRDIVYGVRSSRRKDSLLKRATAQWFYWLLGVMGVDTVADHADFRLMSGRAIAWLREFGEVDLFLRGLVPLVSANTSLVYYERQQRAGGKTKYSVAKMLAFAWRGIASTTTFPLRLVSLVGFLISAGSVAMAAKSVFTKLFTTSAVPGWASTVVPIYLLGGLQILCLGVIGEYVAKVFLETKRRPRFLVETRIDANAVAGIEQHTPIWLPSAPKSTDEASCQADQV
jgi:glycosyltransferase involved in cell wall biosynthesis